MVIHNSNDRIVRELRIQHPCGKSKKPAKRLSAEEFHNRVDFIVTFSTLIITLLIVCGAHL